jgi:hypothetical protein
LRYRFCMNQHRRSPGLGLPREESHGALEDVALLRQAPDALAQLPELLALGAGNVSWRSPRSACCCLLQLRSAPRDSATPGIDRPDPSNPTASRRNCSGYGGLVFGMPVHPSSDACAASAQDSAKTGEFQIASCAIVPTSANTDVAFVHDRMPVVLDGVAAEDAWLDPEVDLDAALEFVRPLPDGLLDVNPLSTKINSTRVEGIQLLTPLDG